MSVSALARRLGVAPSTLRTWDRRYGIGPSVHAQGSHRRYTPRDVFRLECMQRALAAGANPAEAAKHAINTVATHSSESGHEVDECTFDDNSVNAAQMTTNGEGGAPMSATAVRSLIADALAESGVVGMWTNVGIPVMAGAYGEPAARTFGEDVTGLLSTLLVDAPVGAGRRTLVVSVAGPDRDAELVSGYHSIECRALAAALATGGVNTRLVTALDRRALSSVVALEGPELVVLWVADTRAEPAAVIRALRRRHRGLTFVVGGPGISGQFLPRSARTFGTLEEAVSTVVELAHRSNGPPR